MYSEVPEKLREGAVAGAIFCNSDNGWINAEIYLEWLKFFLKSPVLLIQDGHASHISIELIELARSNDDVSPCTYNTPIATSRCGSF